jgi:hypothetical protein
MKTDKTGQQYLSYMGQLPNIEISDAIMEYLHFGIYATPKRLIKEIYPIYEKRYSEDTFRRLLTRNINRLKKEKAIIEHPLRPFYCLPECRWILDGNIVVAVKRDRFNLLDQNEEQQIIDCSAKYPEKGAYTFIEYLTKEKRRMTFPNIKSKLKKSNYTIDT